MKKSIVLFILIAFTFSCENESKTIEEEPFEIVVADDCDGINFSLFDNGTKLALINNPVLPELSGIAASQKYKGYFWTHNDSGTAPDIHLLDSNGNYVATFPTAGGNQDWEDIACVKSPIDGKSYIYVADIGDNNARRNNIRLVKFEEPNFNINDVKPFRLENVEFIDIEYPDGPKDAETLIIDPMNLDIYIGSKREFRTRIFYMKYPYTQAMTEHVATLPFRDATAGDISYDGSEILVRTTSKIYYWKRQGNENLKHTFARQPLCLPIIAEPQGEAIAFSHNKDAYVTVSEFKGYEFFNVTFNKFRRK